MQAFVSIIKDRPVVFTETALITESNLFKCQVVHAALSPGMNFGLDTITRNLITVTSPLIYCITSQKYSCRINLFCKCLQFVFIYSTKLFMVL